MRARALLTVSLVMLGVAAAGPARGAIAATSPSPCPLGEVRVWQYSTTGGLAGSAGDLFWVRYLGAGRCSLTGYPGVAFLGARGQDLGVAVHDRRHGFGNDQGGVMGARPAPLVVLTARADLASFWVFGSDVNGYDVNGHPVTCITSYAMTVSLPGSRARAVVPALRGDLFPWCGPVVVHPFVAGRSGNDPPRSLAYFFGHPAPMG